MPIRKKAEVTNNKEVENSEWIETKHCPFCDNEIRIKAIKCQYCWEFLNEETLNKKTKEVDKVNDNAKINKKAGQFTTKLMKFLGSIMIILWLVIIRFSMWDKIIWNSFGIFSMILDIMDYMDKIIWTLLIVTGILWMVSVCKDKWKYFWIWFTVLWLFLIFSYSRFTWVIAIWVFAFWALLRCIVLTYYGIKNKQEIWCFLLILMLFILFIILAFSDKENAITLSWICIWCSTIIDGLLLIIWPSMINGQKNICK